MRGVGRAQVFSVQLTSKTGFDLSSPDHPCPQGEPAGQVQNAASLQRDFGTVFGSCTARCRAISCAHFSRRSGGTVITWPKDITPTPAFERAAAFMEEPGGNLFVTGRAGTGKSTLLKALRDAYADRMVVLAPTGLAAINIGGQTIHSFFGFPPRLIQPDDIRRSRNGRVMRKLDFIVIDEASMVRSDLMWGIDHALRVNRGGRKSRSAAPACCSLPTCTNCRRSFRNARFSPIWSTRTAARSSSWYRHSAKVPAPRFWNSTTFFGRPTTR